MTALHVGLDADFLDGVHGSYYLNASNMASGNLPYARMPTGNGSWDTGVGTTITITRALTVSGGPLILGAPTGSPSGAIGAFETGLHVGSSYTAPPVGGIRAEGVVLSEFAGAAIQVITSGGNNAAMGDVGHGVAFAAFAHLDRFNVNDYALLHQNTGATYLNAASGQLIRLRIANVDEFTLSATAADFQGNAVSMGALTATTIHGQDGSVTVPAFSFSSDPNTGIRRVGTDSFGIVAGGSDLATFIWDGTTNRVVLSAGTQLRVDSVIAMRVQAGDPATLGDWGHIYTKDVAASAEVFVRDEGGTATQISPHDPLTGEFYHYSYNRRTRKGVRIRLERFVNAVIRELRLDPSLFVEDFYAGDELEIPIVRPPLYLMAA